MPSFPTPGIQRRWKALPGEPVGDGGDPYTGYDRFGRTERMRWVQPQEDSSFLPLVDVAWGYNRASQKTWRRDALAPADTGQDQHFGYDGLYQVTERQRGLLNTNTTSVGAIPAQQENFAYDQTGNWQSYRQQNDGVLGIEESRVNNRSNQITQVDGSSAGVGYDKNGNMLEVPTGEGLTGPASRLEWDAWNRLKRVFDAEDNLIAEYEYDGLGRRTTETVGGVTRHFYYDDQWRVVEERLDEATTAERQYVWHPSDRWELILRDRSTEDDGTLDERLYPLKDELDPVALCDVSGTLVERYAYSAFGLPTFLSPDFTLKEDNSSSFDWNFLFHAEFQDASTGWFNYGYRYYVPALGRWLSRDPIGVAGGINLYGMVGNDLVTARDFFGLATSLADQLCKNCYSVVSRANGWDYVQKLKARKNTQKQFCLTDIACITTHNTNGSYYPDSGMITLACCKDGKPLTEAEIEVTLRHELAHADSLCRSKIKNCDSCITEEMQAYARAGECDNGLKCAVMALASCNSSKTCPENQKIKDDWWKNWKPPENPVPPIPQAPKK